MRTVGELAYWEVTLLDGHTVEVWADGYQELDAATIEALAQDALNGPERGGDGS